MDNFRKRERGSAFDQVLNSRGLYRMDDPRHPDFQWYQTYGFSVPYDPNEASRLHESWERDQCQDR